jgi:hypothetical protein
MRLVQRAGVPGVTGPPHFPPIAMLKPPRLPAKIAAAPATSRPGVLGSAPVTRKSEVNAMP